MRGQAIHWSDAHEAVIREWVKKYPKGKSIDLKMIEFNEPEKWKELLAANHNPGAMRDKARYLLGTRAKNPPRKYTPTSTRATPLGDGRYKCNECGEILPMKQVLGAHYRQHDLGKKKMRVDSPLLDAEFARAIEETKPKPWHYCPNCSFPLDH